MTKTHRFSNFLYREYTCRGIALFQSKFKYRDYRAVSKRFYGKYRKYGAA